MSQAPGAKNHFTQSSPRKLRTSAAYHHYPTCSLTYKRVHRDPGVDEREDHHGVTVLGSQVERGDLGPGEAQNLRAVGDENMDLGKGRKGKKGGKRQHPACTPVRMCVCMHASKGGEDTAGGTMRSMKENARLGQESTGNSATQPDTTTLSHHSKAFIKCAQGQVSLISWGDGVTELLEELFSMKYHR